MQVARIDADEHVVVVQVGKDVYGVNIGHVQEIIAMRSVSRIPLAPASVKGVINLRGKVVPVVDIRQCMGLPSVNSGEPSRVIVVRTGDEIVGIAVDSASDVLRVSADAIEPPARVLTGAQTDYFLGIARVADRIIGILDLEKLLQARASKARSLITVATAPNKAPCLT